MRSVILLLFLACAPLLVSQTIAITNVTVIDGTGASRKPRQTVLVRGQRIAAVGGKVRVPLDAQRIDGTNKFIIPGLWDMHTHVAGISADPKWGKQLLPIYLAHGVVGIRDMAGDLDTLLAWKREQTEGKLTGPRMYVSGPFLDGSAKGYGFPTDVIEVTTPDMARAKVRELKTRGADFIKIGSRLSPEVYESIALEAKAEGIPFGGHVPDSVPMLRASELGARSMEHLFGTKWALTGKEQELRQRMQEARAKKDQTAVQQVLDDADKADPAATAALFASFKQNGNWQVPTLIWTSITSALEAETNSPMLALMPKKLQDDWGGDKAAKLVSENGRQFYKKKLKEDFALVRQLASNGVPLLAGSDSLDPYVFPGDSLWKELNALNQAGLTPMQALQAATLNAAKFLGREKDFGTIERGKIADLVLLDRNPLEDLSARPLISGVMQNGRYYSRAELQKLVEQGATKMDKAQ